LVAGSIALVVVAILWLRSSDAPAPESPSASAPTEKPAPTTPPAQPSAEPSKPAAVSKPPSAETVSKGQAPAASVSARPVVATARLCQEFSTGGPGDWSCVPVSAPVAAGPLVFYTRLKSPIDTTVEHRWYRGDELRQTRRLSIETNTDTGYRTYSRYPVDGTGDWKVELRSRDGSLLHEERFTVR
jgi:hypothetical protein